jgi:hypothetical protein
MKAQSIAAAGLLFALGAHAQATIYSGTGFGTYYYDVKQVNACNNDFSLQNTGPVECSLMTALSLNQVNSQYLVAMNHTQLVGDMASYCGKRVIVSANGVPSSLPLFIGDGCQRCGTGSASNDVWDSNGAPGLDFSYSVLSELSESACSNGHISISWEIVDDTLYSFDTNSLGTPQGPVAGNGSSGLTVTAAPAFQMTTVATVVRPTTSTGSPTVSNDPSTATSAISSNPSGPCETGAWQCNVNVLEQCLDDRWAPRITCEAGSACQGGSNPYCAPYGWA